MKKLISFLLVLAIPLYALPLAAGAEGSDEQAGFIDLKNLVDNATTGGTITLDGDAEVNADTVASPWTIGKNITINGNSHTVYVRTAGILLNGNVTFKNIDLRLTSTDGRNAIIANGHSLTLDTVTAGNLSINLFGGTLKKASSDKYDVPSPGTAGIINIKGKTKLQGSAPGVLGSANIFAGNLSIGRFGENIGEDGDGEASTFNGNVTINIEDYADGNALGTIYAGGGQQRTPQGASAGKETTPNPDKYKVDGTVTITGAKIPDVDGAGATKTDVAYNASPNATPTRILKNISSLSVQAGKLIMATGSSFRDEQALTVNSGAELNIAGCASPIGNFSGGGTLVLGENQQLTINGTVSGETKVRVGNISNDGTFTDSLLTAGKTYIKTSTSPTGTFILQPYYPSQSNFTLQNDGSGNWKVVDPNAGTGQKILVKSLTVDPSQINIDANKTQVEIPYEAEFEETNSTNYLFFVPLTVLRDNASTTSQKDENEYYYYTWTNSDGSFVLELDEDNFIFRMSNKAAPIPAGTYNFNISVPTANCAAGVKPKAQFTVTIPEDTPDPSKPTQIDVPAAKTGLKYTGQEQTGVEAGTGYTLSGRITATEIGSYTATATLNAGYQWKDGTSSPKTITWSISKGAAPAAPTGLKAVSPTKKDGRDGKISGTTDKMEYATNSDFSSAKDCTGDTITGLPAGTYYVRVKETDKYEAGSYAVVKVLAFGEVEVVPEPPAEVKVPVSGEEKTMEVTASVSGSTAVVSAIDTTQLGSVIGEKVDTGMVRIDFSGLKQEVDTVELPGSAIREIAAAAQAQSNDVDGLALKLSSGSVSFDAAALDSIQKQAGSKVTLKILEKERQDLTAAQQEIIGTAPTFDISLQGSAAITDFGTGKAAVSLPYALKPGQSAAGIVVYHLGEDKKTSACPTQYSQVEKTATYTTSHFSLYFVGFDPSIQWKNPFNDVRKGEWFYEAVEFAELNGLMQGNSKTVFAPNQKLSRAQIAQILYNKESRPRVSGSGSFTDVPAREWYADAVNWAAQKGYVKGYDSSHFGPNDSVTREQLAAILWRYAGEPTGKKAALSSFTDAGKASEYALPALRWAVQNEIVRGKGNNRLDPAGTATRAEVAQMLMNYLA